LSDTTLISPDEVRRFMGHFHSHAKGAVEGIEKPGFLQLICIDPRTCKPFSGGRFEVGDVDGMAKAAIEYAADANVYVEPRTIAENVPLERRGTEAETRAVFAFVLDRDDDKGKFGTSNATPSMVVETSPGNEHDWYFLDKPLSWNARRDWCGDARAHWFGLCNRQANPAIQSRGNTQLPRSEEGRARTRYCVDADRRLHGDCQGRG
jgi:hypothetical protein